MFGKTLNLLWKLNYAIGPIFIVVNGQILNKLPSDLDTLVVIIKIVKKLAVAVARAKLVRKFPNKMSSIGHKLDCGTSVTNPFFDLQ